MAAIYITVSESIKTNIALKAVNGQDYVLSDGINKGALYRGRLDGTLEFITNNFESMTDQAIEQFITNNPAVLVPTGLSVGVLIDYTANATISAGDVVTSTGLIGDSSVIAQKNKIIGIAVANIGAGFIGQAVGFGKITNSSWSWTIGDKIFLNGTSLSTTAPSTGFIQIIGTATASDTIDVKLAQSLLL